MKYNIKNNNGIHVIRVDTLVNEYEHRTILEEVEELIADGNLLYVVDFQDMEYLNSTGLNFLIKILTLCRNSDGECVIANISAQVLKLLVITKIKSLFSIFDSVEEAVASFESTNIES